MEERTQDSFFDEKEQVIEMYSKFLEGTRLSYEDRSIITSFDQKVSSFEQMQMRLETIGKIKIENPHIDLSIKEAALEGTRGEEAEMNAITSAEYFELSKNERAEPFLQEKNYTKEPVFSSVQDARNWIFEQQVTYMQEWLSVQDSSLFGEHEQEVIDSLEVEFKNGRTQMKLLYIDDRYKLPVTSNSVEQILENIFKNAPTLVSNAMDFVNEKSLTFENNVLDSLATLYELKDDMAFTSENYAKIFGYPSISHERDILKNIRQQRSEQLFDWVYNETYPLGTTIEYRHDRLLTLDKKIVDGHQFFLADENTELMIRSSPKVRITLNVGHSLMLVTVRHSLFQVQK
ncbi:hypothetical protein [Enterococcus rivorum]|uniref:hypothetical protein n=1 Tax=Enterococcus rivorum TaxID=762845 RepID=UPI00362B1EB6